MLIHLAERVRDGEPVVDDLVTVARALWRLYKQPGQAVRLDAGNVRVALTVGLHSDPHAAMADAMHRVCDHGNYVAATAGQVRAVFGALPRTPVHAWLAAHSLAVLPCVLPAADDAPVVVYNPVDVVSGMVRAVGLAEDGAEELAACAEAVMDRVVRHGPLPWETGGQDGYRAWGVQGQVGR